MGAFQAQIFILCGVTFVRSILICICALFFNLAAHADPAEPLNVLVGDITFSRPEAWKWEFPLSKTTAVARFVIPTGTDKPALTDVRFLFGIKNAAASATLWKGYFPDSKEEDFSEEKVTVAKYNLTYLTIRGTYVFPGSKGKTGQTWIGIVIPSEKQYVQVRLFGPSAEVKAATPLFRKMVENALRDKAAE